MVPHDPVATGRERKARSLIDFAVDLQTKLPPSRAANNADLLLTDVGVHIKTASSLDQKGITRVSSKASKDLERQGRNLWNICVRLKREEDDAALVGGWTKLLVRARVFAFQILTLGREGNKANDAESEIVYLLNLAFTASRLCVADADMEAARTVLQKAANYVEQLKALPVPTLGGAQLPRKRFEAEYLAMRMALSWKENNLDVAEHMFNKIEYLQSSLDSASTENIVGTLQHIGVDLSSKGDHAMALKWIRRSHAFINAVDLGQLSADGLELRLAIYQAFIQALLGMESPACIQEATDLAAYVESEVGDKPVVLHWRLEILQKSPGEVFDAEVYSSILRRMVRSFDFSEGTFSFLLYHARELRDKNSKLACGVMDELLTQRVLQSGNTQWIAKALVRRIWMASMEHDSGGAIADLSPLLESIRDAIPEPLGPDAIGAAHSLIWKRIDALFAKNQYQTAGVWCSVALHPIFLSCGEANRGKFGRKLILCALGLNDAESARAAFHAMPEASRREALTNYLMFKVSLISWDHELGRESIRHLSESAERGQNQDILYACIREAQQLGDKLCTLTALKAVADTWDPDQTSSSTLPCILRCTIRLIHLIEEQEGTGDGSEQSDGFSEDICRAFGRAAELAKQDLRDHEGNRSFTVAELHWFRKNSYNIGATKCQDWELSHLIRIFNTCLIFIGCYPSDMPLADVAEMALMSMRCHFVVAAALVSLARTEDKLDEKLQRYLEVRHHVAEFDAQLQTEVGAQDEEVIRDLLAKMSTLFVFDFEGAVCLKSWDDLGQIVRKAKVCKDEVMYKAMGDCLLRSQAPGKVVFATMRLVINEIFALQEFDNERLAKYIRCMFQAILPLDDGLALQLVDQAIQIARESSQMGKASPPAELEWLAATAFNHAVDFYARGEEQPCHRWALGAMGLTEYMGDGGGLRRVLQDKFAKLRFDGRRGGR